MSGRWDRRERSDAPWEPRLSSEPLSIVAKESGDWGNSRPRDTRVNETRIDSVAGGRPRAARRRSCAHSSTQPDRRDPRRCSLSLKKRKTPLFLQRRHRRLFGRRKTERARKGCARARVAARSRTLSRSRFQYRLVSYEPPYGSRFMRSSHRTVSESDKILIFKTDCPAQAGADPTQLDARGRSALSWAARARCLFFIVCENPRAHTKHLARFVSPFCSHRLAAATPGSSSSSSSRRPPRDSPPSPTAPSTHPRRSPDAAATTRSPRSSRPPSSASATKASRRRRIRTEFPSPLPWKEDSHRSPAHDIDNINEHRGVFRLFPVGARSSDLPGRARGRARTGPRPGCIYIEVNIRSRPESLADPGSSSVAG